jgi:hypothetical protein
MARRANQWILLGRAPDGQLHAETQRNDRLPVVVAPPARPTKKFGRVSTRHSRADDWPEKLRCTRSAGDFASTSSLLDRFPGDVGQPSRRGTVAPSARHQAIESGDEDFAIGLDVEQLLAELAAFDLNLGQRFLHKPVL